MRASVIVPNYRNDDTLGAAMESLEHAAKQVRGEVEIIVIEDKAGKGLSWARNQGLDRAKGEYVFFCDADDTVREDFFKRPIEELDRTQADMCLFNNTQGQLKRSYNLEGDQEVTRTLVPAFIGYGWKDLARALMRPWRFFGELARHRESGSVCRAAFRRAMLETGPVRFNEHLFIYEDAPFMCECAIRSKRTASIPDVLYNYTPGEHGIVARITGTEKHWAYKSEILRERERLNRLSGGDLRRYYAASQILGKLEFLLHSKRKFGIL